MRMKVSNYIAGKLVEEGISQVFSVTGGGAMHLNDALGHQEGLNCLYNHHEQACAIAAESYARIHNRIAALCVTTGPGGTNAITGVVGGWLDSIPMFVLSGQVRYDTTARWSGVGIRAMGDQEFDITRSIDCMTKYSEMVIDPMRIRFCVEKALYLSQSGRKGPTWLDIPLDIQGAYVETDALIGFDPADYEAGGTGWAEKSPAEIPEDTAGKGEKRQILPPKVTEDVARQVIEKIRESKRPVFNVGSGIRLAGAHDVFLRVADKLGIPLVTGWNSTDAVWDEHPLYVGRAGGFGDRPGNFAVQNSDLVFSVGSRLSIRQVGYNYETWARAAYVIVNDIDPEELKKPSVHADMRIHADAKDLLEVMELETGEMVLVPEQTPAGLEGIQSGFLSAVGFGTDGRLHIQFRYGEGINAAESTLHLEVGSRSYEASGGGDQAAYDRLLRYFDMGEDGGETLFEYGGAWYQDTCYNIWPSDWEDVSLGGVSGRFIGGELIEGEWNLSIPLENVPHRRIPVGEYIGHIRLTYLDLTAMGMSVESDPGETPDTLGYPASLFFSDGTTLALGKPDTTSNGQGYSFNHWSTEAPIDPGQVVGVSIGMRYIPIQSGDTAGPGYWLAELPAQETESG